MGNKNDLGNKEVSFEKAEEFSNRLGLAFFEVSCAEAKNVDFIFDGIAKKMLGKVHPAVNEEHRRDIVNVGKPKGRGITKRKTNFCS